MKRTDDFNWAISPLGTNQWKVGANWKTAAPQRKLRRATNLTYRAVSLASIAATVLLTLI